MKRPAHPWTADISDEVKRKAVEAAIIASADTLERLDKILAQKLEQASSKETKLEAYDSPSWGPRQAHLNGYRGALTEIRQLLSFLDQGD